jgi:tRNA threonylcarbamoyladenosine biosynthesis protein TsaB
MDSSLKARAGATRAVSTRPRAVRISRWMPPTRTLNLLALETSSEYCSVALWRAGALDARASRAGQRHTEFVLGMVDELLREHRLSMDELSAVAFGEGPGSFTGLRIACGLAQGLAFGAELPVIGVGTLLAMAAGTQAQRVVCCVDARVSEIYHAAYEMRGETWETVCEPSLCAPGGAPHLTGDDWLACGDAFAVYREALLERYDGRLAAIEAERVPHAREIAKLAAERFAAGGLTRAEDASPLYLRNKVALRIDERPRR